MAGLCASLRGATESCACVVRVCAGLGVAQHRSGQGIDAANPLEWAVHVRVLNTEDVEQRPGPDTDEMESDVSQGGRGEKNVSGHKDLRAETQPLVMSVRGNGRSERSFVAGPGIGVGLAIHPGPHAHDNVHLAVNHSVFDAEREQASEPFLGSNVEVHVLAVEGGGVVELHREKDLSIPAAVVNVVKLTLGAGSFAIPWCFQQSGLAAGCAGILGMALFTYVSVGFLLSAKDALLEKGIQEDRITYASIASHALGPNWSILVQLATSFSCLFACAGYVAFISGILEDYVDALSLRGACMLLVPILTLLSWIRTWKHVSLWSALGNLAFGLTMLAVVSDVLSKTYLIRPLTQYPLVQWRTLPLLFGPVTFLFCFPYCIIPIESEMRVREHFRTYVMPISLGICGLLNVAFGLVCYMVYQDTTRDNVVRNLTQGPLVAVVSVGLAVDLLFTYALMLAPPREYLEEYVLAWFVTNRDTSQDMATNQVKHETIVRNVVRFLLVLLTVGIAVVIPSFAGITGLVGSFSDTLMSGVLPPLMLAGELSAMSSRKRLLQGVTLLGSLWMLFITSSSVQNLFV
ncbi:Amino acid transporter ANT1 [Porphyridium purpureum]|uniref:Amino acid transporter ANT1 n=1 Tax=Porphyridium purpureum TaxID=35688 RepID=A0A5J4YLW1_PORPP|nr:Amino acid transporter ANT1 [Porphyridium purpureum]|eukprot:POR7056..scf246_12